MTAAPKRRRFPLRWTAGLTGLLLLAPALVLLRSPRPRAQGLERLLAQASLLQSFPATPQRPVPALWRERLGEVQAGLAWRRQGRIWWQFWGRDGDGGAFLALPARGVVSGPLPAHALRVDDLLVLAPDPLSQRLLQDQLRLAQRPQRGLEQRCLQRLQQEQAVFWSPLGLGLMAGPVAPLLQRYQEGCLSLSLKGTQLDLQGEASATAGLLTAPGPAVSPSLPGPLPDTLLLEWRGPALEAVLQGLLSRQLIREPLAVRYGVGDAQLALLRRAPFVLQLRPLPKGPYQAGLSLQLAVSGDRTAWMRLLAGLQPALAAQGLTPIPAAPGPAQGAVRWQREDGTVVGGWRWLRPPAADPQLLLFLGPEPAGSELARLQPSQLRVRPQALGRLGLLPPALPLPLQQADQLTLVAVSGDGAAPGRPLSAPLSQLSGRLQLQPRPGTR